MLHVLKLRSLLQYILVHLAGCAWGRGYKVIDRSGGWPYFHYLTVCFNSSARLIRRTVDAPPSRVILMATARKCWINRGKNTWMSLNTPQLIHLPATCLCSWRLTNKGLHGTAAPCRNIVFLPWHRACIFMHNAYSVESLHKHTHTYIFIQHVLGSSMCVCVCVCAGVNRHNLSSYFANCEVWDETH